MSQDKTVFDRFSARVEKSRVRLFFLNLTRRISEVLRFIVSTGKGRWITALVCGVVLSFVCYIMDNQPYNILEKSQLYYFLELPFRPKTQTFDTNVCFVNVSHDRQLVDVNPDDHDAGNTDIADRGKLLQFLRKIKEENVRYEGIILDIRFEKKLKSVYDDSLFSQIVRMRNIVVADHRPEDPGEPLVDPVLQPKLGMSDYKSVGNVSNFSRYSFLQGKKPSIALKMYDEHNGQPTSVKRLWRLPVYFSKGHLCVNSPMLFISGTVYSVENLPAPEDDNDMTVFDYMAEYPYYEDLGADFLNMDERDWKADLDGKYIVIADFENDVHDTYVGKVPGAYIIWMAYKHLQGRHHILSWLYIFLTIIGYMLVFYFQFFINGVANRSEYSGKEVSQSLLSAVRWIASFGFLFLLTFFFYKCFQTRYNITVPVLFVTGINFLLQMSNKHEKNTSDFDSCGAAAR